MSIYDLDKLMKETRRLAVEYRKTTGQTLPVSADLAIYDAIRLMNLEKPSSEESGVDAILGDKKIQIKGRVIFDTSKMNQRIGQLNEKGNWDFIYLVLFNSEYQTTAIFAANREQLKEQLNSTSKNARGKMTVRKFQILSHKIWPEIDVD